MFVNTYFARWIHCEFFKLFRAWIIAHKGFFGCNSLQIVWSTHFPRSIRLSRRLFGSSNAVLDGATSNWLRVGHLCFRILFNLHVVEIAKFVKVERTKRSRFSRLGINLFMLSWLFFYKWTNKYFFLKEDKYIKIYTKVFIWKTWPSIDVVQCCTLTNSINTNTSTFTHALTLIQSTWEMKDCHQALSVVFYHFVNVSQRQKNSQTYHSEGFIYCYPQSLTT